MQAGATTIKLMADISDIQRRFTEVAGLAQRTATGIGRAFDGLGLKIGAALSVGGLAAWVKSAINAADETSKLAQKTGVAVKDIAGLQLAFRQAGLASEQLVPAMAKLGVAIANGNEALAAMGVQTRNADGSLKSTRQVLGEVAGAFAGYQDGAAKTALAVKLFGEEGAKLLPLLNGGAQALDDFDAMAAKLGLTLDEATGKQAERFNDTLDLIGQGVQGVGRQVAAQLLPTLSGLADQFFTSMSEGDRLRRVADFLGATMRGLYVVALGVVEAFKTVGTVLGGVGAIVVSVLSGDFSAARDIAQQLKADLTGGWRDTLAQMEQAWKGAGSASLEALASTTAALRKQAPLLEDQKKAAQAREKAEQEALKARIAAAKAANEAWDDEWKRLEAEREATEGRIRSGREMLEQIQFETKLLGLNNQEREIAVAMRELERQGVVDGTEAYKAFAQAIREAITQREGIKEAQRLRQQELDEWRKHWDQVSASFVDALMQGGRSVAEYLKSLFRTLVLRPILAPIGTAFASMFGAGPAGATGLGGGAGGGVGGTMNILTSAKSAFDAIKGGFASLGDSVAFAAQNMGAWLVNNTTGILNQAGGALMQSAGSIGAAASMVGGVAAGIGLGNMISGQYAALGNKNVSTIAGTAIGAFFGGPIGAAIGGALGGAFNRLFGRKAPVSTGSGISGTFGTGGASVRGFSDMFAKGGVFRSDKAWTEYSAVSSELDKFLDGSLQQMTAATKMYALVLGQNADAINGITQAVKISLKDLSPEEQQKAITEALAAFGDRLAAVYVQQFVREGETASQTLQRLGASLMTVNQVFDTLTVTLMEASLRGGDAASALLEAFGGTEAFVQATTAYYQAFYSEAERTSIATRQLTETLASMGFALPATREEFRALVEAQDLYTESGRQNYAALVNLSTIFDQITPKVAGLGEELRRMVEQATSAAVAVVDEQLQASREAARAARDNATAYFGAAAAIRAASSGIFQRSLSGQASAAFLGGQFSATIARARGGDVAAMQTAGAAGAAFLDAFKSTAATRSDYLRQTAIVQSQLEQTALVADAMGAAADYQALLLDVNTATLEALRESLQTEGVSVELLRSQLDALQRLGQMIDASIAGQTSAYGDLTGEQIVELQAIAGAAGESATLTNLVARATGNNALLSEAILGKLETPDAGARYLAQVVALGNSYVAGRVDGVIAAINAQTAEQQAALLLQQQQELQAAQQQASASLTTSTGSAGSTGTVSSDPYDIRLSDQELYTLARQLEYQRNELLYADTAMFASGGYHTGGLRIVGERGPELEATGPARYYSAQQTAGMLGGGSAADEIRALREEVAMLRYEARATAENTGRTQRLMQRVTRDGESLQIVDVTPA